MLKRNTTGLHQHVQNKRDLAFERTELAIQKLLEEKKSINFGTVAQEAGVSRTWLYKQIEVRERIELLRKQQVSFDTTVKKKPDFHQLESKSFQPPEQLELQQRVNKLTTENLVLRQHLEVVYGMSDSQLVRTVEALQVENAELKRQLQELNVNNYTTVISNQVNRQLNERIYTLEMEKAELLLKIEQLTQQINQSQLLDDELNSLKSTLYSQSEEIKLLQAQLTSANSELKKYQKSSSNKSQFNPASATPTPQNGISCELKKQLSEIGINLNSALTNLILDKSDEQILHALSIVRDYIARGEVKKSKAGIFRRALEENWSSTEPSIEIAVNTNSRLIFNEWYTLARKIGIVQDYREEGEVTMVQDNTDQWFTFEEFSNKWTLEYLKRRQNPHK